MEGEFGRKFWNFHIDRKSAKSFGSIALHRQFDIIEQKGTESRSVYNLWVK